MTNFNDMLSKAKEMQEKMKEVQENLKNIEVEGVSGGNLVTVILSGDYELKKIKINEEAKKEEREVLNDLIIAAYNNAKENLKKKSAEELSKVTGGLNIPFDLKMPF
jgi:DNA-binding YbaB/EbfC family protein